MGPERYSMVLDAPSIAKTIRPGQFIHVRCSGGLEPLLRRPFSLHRKTGRTIEILYKIVGKGTKEVAKKEKGDFLDIIGPLGNGFDTKLITHNSSLITILVAGGMGIAPLVALAEHIVHSPQSTAHKEKLHVLIGACTKSHILCEDDFKNLNAVVSIATEDGSKGRKGLVTDLLSYFLPSTVDCRLWTIYACGPNAMLAEVARIAKTRRVPCQLSLEERMACGVGVCLGCPVKVMSYKLRVMSYEYKMVCKDGPVFNAGEIIW